jgi:membrane associated rhomboid family serine protease
VFIPLYDHNPLSDISRPYVNWAIIALTVLIYVVFQSGVVFDHMRSAVLSFGAIPAVINDTRVLPAGYAIIPDQTTLVTYALLHGGWLHLIGNMAFLWVFGDNIEDAVGHLRYLLFYLLAAAGGAFAHVLMMPQSQDPLIGASGAIAAVVAAYLMLHPRVRVWVLVLSRFPVPLPALWVLGAWIAMQFVQAVLMSESNVAWWAHIGGIACGAVLIVVLRRRGVKLFDRGLKTT